MRSAGSPYRVGAAFFILAIKALQHRLCVSLLPPRARRSHSRRFVRHRPYPTRYERSSRPTAENRAVETPTFGAAPQIFSARISGVLLIVERRRRSYSGPGLEAFGIAGLAQRSQPGRIFHEAEKRSLSPPHVRGSLRHLPATDFAGAMGVAKRIEHVVRSLQLVHADSRCPDSGFFLAPLGCLPAGAGCAETTLQGCCPQLMCPPCAPCVYFWSKTT